MLTQDYMTRHPVSVYADDPLLRVAEVFDIEKFRHLPVVDHTNCLVGILSDRDMRNIQAAMEILEENISHEAKIQVKDVMTANVRSVDAGSSLTSAAEIILELRIGALPVTEQGKLVGILSYTDVLRDFVDLMKDRL